MFRSDIESSRLTGLLEILTNVFPDGRPSELVLMGLRHPGIVVLASTPWKKLIRSWQWSGYNVTLAWLAQRECFRVSAGASCGQSARRFGLGKSFWFFAGRMSGPGPFTMDRSPCIFRSGPVAPDRSPWTVCPGPFISAPPPPPTHTHTFLSLLPPTLYGDLACCSVLFS